MILRLQKIVVLVFGLCALCMAYTFASDLDTYISSLSKSLIFSQGESISVKNALQKYCDVLHEIPTFTTNTVVYNSQQSAFVFLLCNQISQDTNMSGFPSTFFKGSKTTNKGIFQADTFADLGITDRGCVSSSSTMNGCDFSTFLPDLFNDILNDYSNIKEASLYGATSGSFDKATLSTLATTFASTYFTSVVNLCGPDTRYPQTCSLMKNYIQQGAKTFSNTTIFYPNAIASWANTTPKSDCDLGTGATGYVLFPCALLADHTNSLQGFTLLLYNEMFYYRLFVNYYTLIISANPELISSNPATFSREVSDRVERFDDELLRSQKAISLTLRSLRDTYAAFPLHIGFMLYQEDLAGFGKRFATLTEPLYTLYDKLRNVQQP